MFRRLKRSVKLLDVARIQDSRSAYIVRIWDYEYSKKKKKKKKPTTTLTHRQQVFHKTDSA
jgi:hypothetical protein